MSTETVNHLTPEAIKALSSRNFRMRVLDLKSAIAADRSSVPVEALKRELLSMRKHRKRR